MKVDSSLFLTCSYTVFILSIILRCAQIVNIAHSSPKKPSSHDDCIMVELQAIKLRQARIEDLLYDILDRMPKPGEKQPLPVSQCPRPTQPGEKQPLPVSLCPRPRALTQCPHPLPALTQCTEPLTPRFEDTDLSFSFEYSLTSTHDQPITTPYVPITPTDTTPHIPPATFTPSSLTKWKRDSCSRANFATNLVRVLFTVAERKESNVKGRDKKQLHPATIAKIEDATFQQYPLETGEKRKQAWSVCIKAIDESARRLHRRGKY